MWVTPELLGAPTIGGGSARSRGGGGGDYRSQLSIPSLLKYTKTAKKWAILRKFWLINRENAIFRSKVLNKINSRDVF